MQTVPIYTQHKKLNNRTQPPITAVKYCLGVMGMEYNLSKNTHEKGKVMCDRHFYKWSYSHVSVAVSFKVIIFE